MGRGPLNDLEHVPVKHIGVLGSAINGFYSSWIRVLRSGPPFPRRSFLKYVRGCAPSPSSQPPAHDMTKCALHNRIGRRRLSLRSLQPLKNKVPV